VTPRVTVTSITQSVGQIRRAARTARKIGVRAPLSRNWHRGAVGGLWDEMGQLQFDFLLGEGLSPEHYLLDVGCGSLRGGVRFVSYLEPGRYYGVDYSSRLLAAGRSELRRAGLTGKGAVLVVDGEFELSKLEQSFDFVLAQSVFSHLPFNRIARCVAEVGRVLNPGGRFYATFFANPGPRLRTDTISARADLALQVKLDRDPFYYDPDLFSWLCEGSDLAFEYRGDWGHPRNQHMMVFTKQGAPPG
jgi:SAM-dependent methyltransferase